MILSCLNWPSDEFESEISVTVKREKWTVMRGGEEGEEDEPPVSGVVVEVMIDCVNGSKAVLDDGTRIPSLMCRGCDFSIVGGFVVLKLLVISGVVTKSRSFTFQQTRYVLKMLLTVAQTFVLRSVSTGTWCVRYPILPTIVKIDSRRT